MDQPMRFGTFIGPLHDPAHNPTLAIHRNLELIDWLDQLGFDEAWIGEHHSNGYETIPGSRHLHRCGSRAYEAHQARHWRGLACPTTTPSSWPTAWCSSTT